MSRNYYSEFIGQLKGATSHEVNQQLGLRDKTLQIRKRMPGLGFDMALSLGIEMAT